MLLADGLDAAFDRHRRLGRACRAGIRAMGLDLFSPDHDSSAVVTAARTPEGVDATDLVRLLRDRFGVQLASGHAHLRPSVFRIGHIGYYDLFDIATALSAVELGLDELGAKTPGGAAVAALAAYESA
jgi:aspartate aminotransferase-like enzyme